MSRRLLLSWCAVLSVVVVGTSLAQDPAMWNAAKRWKLGIGPAPPTQMIDTGGEATPNPDSPPNTPDIQVFNPSLYWQSENSIGVNFSNPNHLMVSTNGRIPGSNPVVHQPWAFSTDGGVTWPASLQSEDIPPGILDCFGDPVAFFDVSGRAYYCTLGSPGGIYFVSTTNFGATWSARSNADLINSSNDDKQHAAADFSGTYPNNVYAAWTDFGRTGSPVVFSRSTNQGQTWGTGQVLQIGSNRGQGVHIGIGPNGEVYVMWAHYTTGTAEVGIGFAKSTDGGATFSTPVVAYPINGIRISNGAISQLNGTRAASFPYFDVDRSNGPRRGWIYVVTPELDVALTGQADIYVRRSTDGGATWSSAVRVNGPDVATGRWQWMPSIAVDPATGGVTVSYYSFDSTGSTTMANRYAAYSIDGGLTWDNWVISDVRATWAPQGTPNTNTTYNGDYYETAAMGGKAWAIWTDRRSGSTGSSNRAYVERIVYGENFGWIRGTVTNLSGGAPVQGVNIDFVDNVLQQSGTTDASGFYFAGAYVDTPGTTANRTLRARKFGFVDTTIAVVLTRNDTVTRNFQIRPSPSGTLIVYSHTATTNLRSYVEVKFGTQVVHSDSTSATTGRDTTILPAGTYSVRVDAPPPYRTLNFPSVVINAGQTTNVDALTSAVLTFNPTAMRDTLPVGGSRQKTMVITNTTPDSVRFRITDDNALRSNRYREIVPVPPYSPPAVEKPKGAPDTEFGDSPNGRGGPDAFGYSWIDSDEPDGPPFQWFDIKSVGTQITSWIGSSDDGYASVTLPFTFPFYGNNYTTANVVTNGFLQFAGTSTAFSNTAIPSTALPNNSIYAFWDDLNFAEAGGTMWYYFDSANQRFILQWDSVSHYSPGTTPGRYTFQIVLKPNGEIFTYYRRMIATVNSATIGIENAAGTVGLQVVFNAAYMHDSLAIRFFLPDAPWLSENPVIGTIPPNGTQDIQVTFNAAGLTPGTTYNANIFVEATHPDVTSPFVVPASLRVQAATGPLLVLNKDSLSFPTTPIGSSRTDSVTARNAGDQTLNISSITRNNTDFSVTPANANVAPGDSIRIRVTYTPTVPAGSDTGRVTIVSNSTVNPTAYVRLSANSVGVPIFRARVDSLTKTLQARNVDSTQFFVRNIGTMSGNFQARAVMYPRTEPGQPAGKPIILPVTITPAQENPRPTVTLSDAELKAIVGPAPRSTTAPKPGEQSLFSLSDIGERAFGYEYFTANFVKFNLSTPGTLVNLGTFTTADNIFAGDFTPDGNTLLAIKGSTNQLIRVDTSNGSYTVIGPVTITPGHTWTSMKFDPTNGTLYATSTGSSVSTLYTINPNTGQTTVVGTVTNVPILIAMAISNSGQMYCYDIDAGGTQQSRFFSVDKTTGAGTLIGPMGFIGRFAQDMDFDPETGVLYAASYNFGISPATAELRTINVATGATTLIGNIGTPQREVDFFAIKGRASAGGNWLSIAPTTGTIAVNDSVRFTATFDARSEDIVTNPGTYRGRIEITATNSALADSLNIPVRFTVTPVTGPALFVTPDSVDFGNVPIGQTDSSKSVLIKNIGNATANVTNITSTNPAFAALRTNFSLTPNDTLRVKLRFTAPAPAGLRTGTLSFTSNDPNPPTIRVRGTSIGQADFVVVPDTFTFTRPQGTDTTTATFRIRNTGTDTLRFRIDEASSSSDDPSYVERSMQQQESYELPKGAEDPHPGQDSPNGRGGPDAFGYLWIDSDEPGGPQYNWTDIKNVGTQITTWTGSGDDGYAQVTLPFSFSYYGNSYTDAYVGTNGFVSFGAGYTSFSNTAIPSTAVPNNTIYGFWDDLNFNEPGGTAWYYNDVANQRFIVQWDSVSHYSPGTTPGRYTFQVILYANGNILCQYRRMEGTLNSATIGIENLAGTIGLQVVFNSTYMHDNLAILFTRDLHPWMSVNPTLGTIAPGDSMTIQLRIHPGSMAGGTYTGRQRISGNTPTVRNVGVRLTVIVGVENSAEVLPTVFGLDQNFPNPFNPSTTIRFALPEQSIVSLKVYNLLGQEVATLTEGELPAAFHSVVWNGTNNRGAQVATGIYFYRFEATGVSGQKFSSLKKLILLK